MLALLVLNNPLIYSGDFNGELQLFKFDDNYVQLMEKYTESEQDNRVLYLPISQPYEFRDLKHRGMDPTIAFSTKPAIGGVLATDMEMLLGVSLCEKKWFSYLFPYESSRYKVCVSKR